jgi:uncharacterized YkwD family protein
MRTNRSGIILVILVALMVFLPAAASAATFLNLKITVGERVETFQIPLDKNARSMGFTTYKYVYYFKDGKWTLISQGQKDGGNLTTGIGTKPTVPSTPQKPADENASSENPTINPLDKRLSSDEQKMLEMVNAERKKAGVEPLKIDMSLVEISRKKSMDMIDKKYFGHTSPTYGTPFDALKNNGISYRYAGENIAGASTVEQAHKALMQSPGHRANILNPNFNFIGIGIVDGGPYGKMYTQTFIGTK